MDHRRIHQGPESRGFRLGDGDFKFGVAAGGQAPLNCSCACGPMLVPFAFVASPPSGGPAKRIDAVGN